MKPIATYLFFDLETTGLVEHGEGVVHITELGMLAVKRNHLLNMEPDEEPRVQYKIRMCFNPPKTINKGSAFLSGLNNRDLKNEAEFNKDTFKIIHTFIKSLEKPVCLVAHNGLTFHFPILKYHFKQFLVKLPDDIMCTDSLYAFYDILEPEKYGNSYLSKIEQIDDEEDDEEYDEEYDEECDEEYCEEFGKPKIKNLETKSFLQLRRDRFYGSKFPAESYKLKDIYMRVADGPNLLTNRAENQCIMIMKTAITRAGEFVEWVDRNHCAFSEVPIMIM